MKHAIALLIITIVAAGCGKGPQAITSESTSNPSFDQDGGTTFEVIPQKSTGLISHRQLLPNYQKCLGLPDNGISQATKDALAEAVPSLSLDGSIKDLSAPFMMAVAKVASEVCNDLINLEKASSNRKFFPGFVLGGAAANDSAQSFNFDTTLKNLSKACWGRAIDDKEETFIRNQVPANDKSKATAMLTCTVILSAAEAVKF